MTFDEFAFHFVKPALASTFVEMRESIAYLILRVGLGGMMLTHGWPKMRKILNGDWGFGDPIGLGPEVSLILATSAEFLCSILVIVGLKTRLASIPIAFTMFIAAFVAHIDDPWKKMEFALLYMVGFVCLAIVGGGRYSVDSYLSRR